MAKRVKKSGGPADAGRGSDIVMTRLPEGIKAKVAALAESNGRSMNSEIIAAIEQHLKGPTILESMESRLLTVEAFIKKHRERIEDINTVWGAVEHLESYVETTGGGFRGLLMALHAKQLRDLQGDPPSFITSDQVKEIRRLVKTSGADEKQFLRYMGADKIEAIRDFDRAHAVLQAHWKNPPA